jgi:hypothetical protein
MPNTRSGARASTSTFGYHYPSVLSSLLRNPDCRQSDRILNGIDGVLMEVPGAQGCWQLFGRPAMAAELDSYGLRPQSERHEAPQVEAPKH